MILKNKIYNVEYSGHGSDLKTDPELLTFEEAKLKCYRWVGIANTIVVGAVIRNTITGQLIKRWY